MTRLRLLAIACLWAMTSITILGADAPPPTEAEPTPTAPTAEAQKFNGAWQLIAMERDGVKVGPETISEVRLTFAENQYTYKAQNGDRDQGTFKLDLTRTPRAIVTTHADGAQVGKSLTRIYKWVDADTVKFCSPGPEEKLPDAFAAPRGSGRELATWKRLKK